MSVQQTIVLDLKAFSLEAIKRAAYRLSPLFAFDVGVTADSATCTLIFPDDKGSGFVEHAASEFRKEVLDQSLRDSIRAETQTLRNVILAHAFSRSGLISDEPVQRD